MTAAALKKLRQTLLIAKERAQKEGHPTYITPGALQNTIIEHYGISEQTIKNALRVYSKQGWTRRHRNRYYFTDKEL